LRRLTAVLLALLASQLLLISPAAAAVPLPVAGVLVGGAQTSVVVDLSASTRPGRGKATVTRDGLPQPARLIPVMSSGLAVTLVVDTSSAGAATLPAWLSAAARFALEAPAGTQSVVIGGSAPAGPITSAQHGPTGIVAALDQVRAHGTRDIGAALALAARQFPAVPAGRRVVVLYTTAADAGGESALAVSVRFRTAGTILVVVGTADGGSYWAGATAETGGFFAPAGDPVVVPALDQVETTLRGRYLVQFPTPPTLPAPVSVGVNTGDLRLSGDALVAVPPSVADVEPAPADRRTVVIWALFGAALLAVIATAVLVLLRAMRRPPPPAWPVRASRPASMGARTAALGRAAAPGAVARGRAAVPLPEPATADIEAATDEI
jgi:hypothetical protein